MRLRPLALLTGLAACLAFTGCDTLPVRVLTNYDTYSKLDPQARAHIARGHIELGYTPDMVRLALGRPDSASTWDEGKRRVEIWTYTALDVTTTTTSPAPGDVASASFFPTIPLGYVTFHDGRVAEYTRRFAAR